MRCQLPMMWFVPITAGENEMVKLTDTSALSVMLVSVFNLCLGLFELIALLIGSIYIWVFLDWV